MAAGDFAIGSLNIADGVNYFFPLTSSNPKFTSAPQSVSRLPFARREGSIVSLTRFGENQLSLYGYVYSTAGLSDLDSKMDALELSANNGQVNIKLGWQDERYWKCRLTGSIQKQRASAMQYTYAAAFLVADAFAFALSPSQLAPGAVTLSPG